MPTPTIPAGNLFMDVNLYTGTNATQVITNGVPGQSFQPDMVWIKSRSAAYNHGIIDSVRGVRPMIFPNMTNAEASTAVGTGLTSFNSDGFTLGTESTTSAPTNENGTTFVAWQWKAGGTAVSNTDGTITSSVSANQTSGFSVVTYTGTGSNASVGHGLSVLGVAPAMVIVKNRTTAGQDWTVYHASLGATKRIFLNTTAAENTSSAAWNNTAPTSTVFSIGTAGDVNQSTANIVAYCWAPIAGYSAFGSYTGNGSADGTFVYTGFRPRFVMFKRTNSTGEWGIWDTSRSPYNASTFRLSANSAAAELNQAATTIDILSNGIKFRTADSDINASGSTYVYACWAENPFKYSNAR
jgi:hypothetical protein